VLLAQRGLRILALEPDPAMAAVARANCTSYPGVEIVESDFERFPAPARRPAIISAQAWHWIDPETRYRKAHEALHLGGKLLAMWTLPKWESCAVRQAFAEVYRATVVLNEIDATVARAGGAFTMHYLTRVCVATATA
jgi:hypothetical protein